METNINKSCSSGTMCVQENCEKKHLILGEFVSSKNGNNRIIKTHYPEHGTECICFLEDKSDGFWKGRRLKDLSKEELCEAVVELGKLYKEALLRRDYELDNFYE